MQKKTRPIALTNNSLAFEAMSDREIFSEIVFDEHLSLENILKKAEGMIKSGHRLLINPLYGNLPLDETVYKTLVFSEKNNTIDFSSINIITAAIHSARKSSWERPKAVWGKNDLDCFKKNDLVIVERWLIKIHLAGLTREEGFS